jgi:catechol 2,3-dioxygenase-like lactoylglutathione lyase family enzyme
VLLYYFIWHGHFASIDTLSNRQQKIDRHYRPTLLAHYFQKVTRCNGQVINPIEKGHIAFRTDDLSGFLAVLDTRGIPYSDYGTTFSAEWHQVFFQDPEGNVIEVHERVS